MTRIFLPKHCHPTLLFGVVVLAGGGARAGSVPVVSVSSEGGCPSEQELVTALRRRGLSTRGSAQPTSYAITSYREPTGAQLVLRRRTGEVVLRRSFQSPDCAVLATAMAVVVEALFSDLGERGNDAARSSDADRSKGTDAPGGASGAGSASGAARPSDGDRSKGADATGGASGSGDTRTPQSSPKDSTGSAATSGNPDQRASPAARRSTTSPADQPSPIIEPTSPAPAQTNKKKPQLA
ncbi:MAG TPA: hypothetical protein VKP30_26460, partial [Polyangiaceae bacterium]|nr:hypothetical protein [Polyangiaceae bacterium]